MAETDPDEARSLVGSLILDPSSLVRALATGRHRGSDRSGPTRVELRYVDLAAGRRLQVVRIDGATTRTTNHGDDAATAVSELLELPFANWHVDTATERVQLQLTRKGKALLTRKSGGPPIAADHSHDRQKRRLLASSDEIFQALGLTTDDGTVKPTRTAKFTQVQDFLATLAPVVADAVRLGPDARADAADEPAELRVADLGCGNAYLTFAAARFLTSELDIGVRITGVDEKAQARRHNTEIASSLHLSDTLRFVEGRIDDVVLDPVPDVVLALHACDTATDEALARAIRWRAGVILAAPCCHRDVQRQLRRAELSPSQRLITRSGILTERLADTLTDAFRAALLRLAGYRVDVVEFVEAAHTPRNTLIRAVRTDAHPRPEDQEAYDALVAEWQVTPALQVMLERAAPISPRAALAPRRAGIVGA
jgi:SAM-dependent methyltransferase